MVDLHVAKEAARLRAIHGFKAPDALIVATGHVARVDHIITNDQAWKAKLGSQKSALAITLLSDFLDR